MATSPTPTPAPISRTPKRRSQCIPAAILTSPFMSPIPVFPSAPVYHNSPSLTPLSAPLLSQMQSLSPFLSQNFSSFPFQSQSLPPQSLQPQSLQPQSHLQSLPPLSFPQWCLYNHLYHLGPLSIPQMEWYYWYKYYYRRYANVGMNMGVGLNLNGGTSYSASPTSLGFNGVVNPGHEIPSLLTSVLAENSLQKPHHPTLSSSNLKTPTDPKSTAPHPPSGQGHVPPGSGKPSTHARNQRRKKKRLYERGVLPALGSSMQGVDGVNAIPLGTGGGETGVEGAGGGEAGGGEAGGGVDPTQVALPSSPSSSTDTTQKENSPKKSQSQGMSRTLSGGVGVGVPAFASSSSSLPTPVQSASTNHAQSASASTSTNPAQQLTNPSSTQLSNPSGTFLSPSQLAMGSFKNKNKKKGFKASMSSVIPRKVMWGSDGEEVQGGQNGIQGEMQGMQGTDEAQAQIVYVPSTPAAPPYQTPTPRSSTFATSNSGLGFAPTQPYPRARLVPPSEIQERGALPERMFVSCVDVEESVWGGSRGAGEDKKRKKKKQRVEYEGWQGRDVDQDAGYAGGGDEGIQWEDEREVVLDYGDDDAMIGPGVEESTKPTTTHTKRVEFDWDHADEIYERAKVVNAESEVVVGGLVGWKTLAINPQTFTPENMLTVARIVEISTPPPPASSSSASTSTQITYKPVHRPPPPEPDYAAMFGFTSKRGLAIATINLQDEDDEMDGQQAEEEEEQVVRWEDVVGMGWRVIH